MENIRELPTYTIGQRKGLNLSMGKPVFVTEIRPETNEVVIGDNEDLFVREVYADRINFMSVPDLKEKQHFKAKIRYAHQGAQALIEQIDDDLIRCTFEEPQRAMTRDRLWYSMTENMLRAVVRSSKR